jgi:hypothetical protein
MILCVAGRCNDSFFRKAKMQPFKTTVGVQPSAAECRTNTMEPLQGDYEITVRLAHGSSWKRVSGFETIPQLYTAIAHAFSFHPSDVSRFSFKFI